MACCCYSSSRDFLLPWSPSATYERKIHLGQTRSYILPVSLQCSLHALVFKRQRLWPTNNLCHQLSIGPPLPWGLKTRSKQNLTINSRFIISNSRLVQEKKTQLDLLFACAWSKQALDLHDFFCVVSSSSLTVYPADHTIYRLSVTFNLARMNYEQTVPHSNTYIEIRQLICQLDKTHKNCSIHTH